MEIHAKDSWLAHSTDQRCCWWWFQTISLKNSQSSKQPIGFQHLPDQHFGWKAKDWWCTINRAIVGRYIIAQTFLMWFVKHGLTVKSSLLIPNQNWMKYMEYTLKAKPKTLQHILISLRHQLNSVLRIRKGGTDSIYENFYWLILYVTVTSSIFYFMFWLN